MDETTTVFLAVLAGTRAGAVAGTATSAADEVLDALTASSWSGSPGAVMPRDYPDHRGRRRDCDDWVKVL